MHGVLKAYKIAITVQNVLNKMEVYFLILDCVDAFLETNRKNILCV